MEERYVAQVGVVRRAGAGPPAALRRGRGRRPGANGWKIVCRQAGPPGSVRIGAITLTSWAWQAMPTRSAWLSRVIRRLPTTAASVTSYSSSISHGSRATPACPPRPQARLAPDVPLVDRDGGAGASGRAVRPRGRPSRRLESMARSRSTALARKLAAIGAAGRSRCVQGHVVDEVVALARAPWPPTPRRSACGCSSCRTRPARSGSIRRIALAVSEATRPYSAAFLWPTCHGPSISLPRHQSRTSWGCWAPFAPRRSESRVPPGWLAVLEEVEGLGDTARAEVDREHRLDVRLAGTTRELVDAELVGLDGRQARSRRRGRSSSGPTPSSQRYPETKLPPG